MFLKPDQRAFSLIELMIVISIIGILSAVSLGSLYILQKNNRDAQRQSDLRLIQGALQQYYADQNHYPDTLILTAGVAITNCTGVTGEVCSVSKTYSSKTPVDPNAGLATPYCYTSLLAPGSSSSCDSATPGQCHSYQLNAKLENSPGSAAYTCNNITTYNFQVTPL